MARYVWGYETKGFYEVNGLTEHQAASLFFSIHEPQMAGISDNLSDVPSSYRFLGVLNLSNCFIPDTKQLTMKSMAKAKKSMKKVAKKPAKKLAKAMKKSK